ncbi:coproporphyrinogen III oxidase [bacterium BMS3Abin01]|nr:coproporphyrinogen III oxidase [bacterium BMS3Abin01]
MKVLLINPPYRSQIIRRYVCSYNAPNFLFPPMELMYLSAQARAEGGCQVRLMDCIAEALSAEEALEQAGRYDPDMVVAIMAIEFFDNDVEFMARLKKELPGAMVGTFGHLPSSFSHECLRATETDFVLVGEPDNSFRKALQRLMNNQPLEGDGVAAMKDDGQFIPADYQRIESLDELPFADQAAIDHSRYGEPFFGHPYTTFQSSRGCPFPCVYCVRTYGRKFVKASAEHVVSEVRSAVEGSGIRYFRFMDDTFTASRERALQICAGLRDLSSEITWSCLTRPNTIDGEVAAALRDAGCRRIYVGIESGSQKVIDYLKRGYRLDAVMDNLREVRQSGLEMVGWFIVGSPVEERADFEQSIALAKKLKLEFIAVSTLVPYPNTELFEREKDNIVFSLKPYTCEFRNQAGTGREAEFYRRYYLNPAYIARKIGSLTRHPGESIRASREFLRYVVASRRDNHRKDLL